MKPDITAANVRIDYSGSGLGFAGDPNGMEIAPLVTVRLTGMQFVPLTGFMFATLNMPDFRTDDAGGRIRAERNRIRIDAVSVINPNETARNWQASKRESAVQLYLSGVEGDSADLVGTRVAGFPLSLNVVPVTDWIDPEELSGAVAAIVQVDASTPSSIKRFQKLAQTVATPLIAAAYDPPLALVRSLVRAGAHDVVPLPLNIEDLETSLAPLREELARKANEAVVGKRQDGQRDQERRRGRRDGAPQPACDPVRRERGGTPARSLPDRSRRPVRRCRLPARPAPPAVAGRPARGRSAARRRSASGDDDRASQRPQGHCRAAGNDAARGLVQRASDADRRACGARVRHGVHRPSDQLDQLVAVAGRPFGPGPAGHRADRCRPQPRQAPARPARIAGSGRARGQGRRQSLRKEPVAHDPAGRCARSAWAATSPTPSATTSR